MIKKTCIKATYGPEISRVDFVSIALFHFTKEPSLGQGKHSFLYIWQLSEPQASSV